ncbi:MAG: hypothetical protein V1644_00630 [Candidatus Micrarchaeota archaeon]
MAFSRKTTVFEHEVFRHVEPEHHEAFKRHIKNAVEKMAGVIELNDALEPIEEIENPALVTASEGEHLHQSYFASPLQLSRTISALKAAERLLKGSGNKTRLSVVETNLKHSMPTTLSAKDKIAQHSGNHYKVELGQDIQAKTSWGKRTEVDRMKSFFDYFHKKLDEAQVETV